MPDVLPLLDPEIAAKLALLDMDFAALTTDTLVALAAFVGKARLIDNVTITFAAGVPTPDLGVLTASSGLQEAEH